MLAYQIIVTLKPQNIPFFGIKLGFIIFAKVMLFVILKK